MQGLYFLMLYHPVCVLTLKLSSLYWLTLIVKKKALFSKMLERWGMGKYIDKYIHIYALYYTSIISSVIEPSSPPNNKKKGEHILWFLLWFWLSFECLHFPKQITNYNAVRFPQSWGGTWNGFTVASMVSAQTAQRHDYSMNTLKTGLPKQEW